jgi:hypothetical protein
VIVKVSGKGVDAVRQLDTAGDITEIIELLH